MNITNARLSDGRLVDISIADGRIASVETAGARHTSRDHGHEHGHEHDLDGWLLLPAMVEPHAHLDKALTADLVPNPAGDLTGAIDAWIQAAAEGRITHDLSLIHI